MGGNETLLLPIVCSIAKLTKFPKIGDDSTMTSSNVPKINPTTVGLAPLSPA